MAVGLISLGPVALDSPDVPGSVAIGAVSFGGVALGLGAIGEFAPGK